MIRTTGVLLAALGGSAAAEPPVTVAVIGADAGPWRVTWTLADPVTALVFARDNGDNRHETWGIEVGFILEKFGATDRLRRADGEPFTAFEAWLGTDADKPAKDYSPFLFFSNGDRALYTGQFIIGEPVGEDSAAFIDGADNDNTAFRDHTLAVDPGPFERTIAGGAVRDAAFSMELGDGDYVFFGAATPVETDAMTGIVDASAPLWLRQHLETSMAQTFGLFTERLGPLPQRPFMLTTYHQLEGERVSFTGGVIGSQLAIEMGLGEEVVDAPGERRFLARFFAHEAAHLWQNAKVRGEGGGASWMHEGGAEAKAWLALVELGLADADHVRGLFEAAANACAGYLASGPLVEAGQREEFRAYYDCGAVIGLATDGAMRHGGNDLFTFWRMLLESVAAEGIYEASDYATLLDRQKPGLGAAVLTFAAATHEEPLAAIRALLAEADLATTLEDGTIKLAASATAGP
ncbi:MAG: hypothetical protein AAGE01_02205 [Pseudomonadota bacterium]